MLKTHGKLGDRYVLLDRIGRGGMGEIWRANDVLLERIVAVKVLLPGLSDDVGSAGRFLAEARTMATVSDAAIVEIYDYGRSGGLTYLVMQYVEGESLHQLLARTGRLPAERTMAIVALAATALQVAHGRGIVHRDVKPGNLLLRSDGQVVLTDFGIATLLNGARLTEADGVVGTASYLAPEQLAAAEVSAATDIYALGVVAYQCLTGRRPFAADTPYEVALMHAEQPPPPLPDTIDPAVRDVVMRAMAKDPADRWPTAQAMATAAEAAGSPVPPTVPVPGTDLVPVHRPLPPVVAGRPWRRRSALVAAGVVAVLAGAAVLVALHSASGAVGMLGAPPTVGTSRPGSGPTDPATGRDPGQLPAPGAGGAPGPGGLGIGGVGGDGGAPGSPTGATPDETTSGAETGGVPPTVTGPRTTPPGFVVVPDLSGVAQAVAVDQLWSLDLRPVVRYAVPEGPCGVVAQDPPGGTAVHRNTVVTLTVGRAPDLCPL